MSETTPDAVPSDADPAPTDAVGEGAAPAAALAADVRPHLVRRLRLSWGGLLGAVILLGVSVTPSLLPRPALMEGAVAGIGALLGYALGVLGSWLWRRFDGPEPAPAAKRRAWQVLLIGGGLLTLFWLGMAVKWQDDVRDLVGEPPQEISSMVLVVVVAVVVFALLLLVGRGLRRLNAAMARWFGRWVPRPLAMATAVVLLVYLFGVVVTGTLERGFVSAMNSIYASTNAGTKPGITQPTSPDRSGSPESLVPWDSLGSEGRNFVARGPDPAKLTAFSGRPAKEPVRVYVGLDSAPDARSRAALAVRELERTRAFDRKVLVVAGTTGTGWLEPQTVDSLEYEWNGDSAIVGIQYSYLPSWISTLVDVQKAQDAGRELFDAVHEAWAALPEATRPKLIAYGLSLGSFSMQSAFGSSGDLAARTDGALFVGSPNFSQPWGDITRTRDSGSPEWQPVYRDGEHVRFIGTPPDLGNISAPWDDPHVVYVQHASDPVVWWTPNLITTIPDWLREAPGPDRTSAMHWFPVVTFLQVTVDQFVGVDVPNGHGHNYATTIPAAWAAVVEPPGWTQADTDKLTDLVAAYAIE